MSSVLHGDIYFYTILIIFIFSFFIPSGPYIIGIPSLLIVFFVLEIVCSYLGHQEKCEEMYPHEPMQPPCEVVLETSHGMKCKNGKYINYNRHARDYGLYRCYQYKWDQLK